MNEPAITAGIITEQNLYNIPQPCCPSGVEL